LDEILGHFHPILWPASYRSRNGVRRTNVSKIETGGTSGDANPRFCIYCATLKSDTME